MGLWDRLRSGLTRRRTAGSGSAFEDESSREWSSEHAFSSAENFAGDDSASVARRRTMRNVAAFQTELDADVIDLDKLSRMAWNGVPTSRRPIVWMLLLGYLPANARRRDAALKRKRHEFDEALKIHFEIASSARSQRDQATLRQILVDVPRTCPSVPLFSQDSVQSLMVRVLYVWAVRHPASGYVQGMNDLLAIFIIVFVNQAIDDLRDASELDEAYDPTGAALAVSKDASRLSEERLDAIAADAYWCITKVLDSIHDHYTVAQPGLLRAVQHVEGLLRRVDAELHQHLQDQCVMILQITFRWLNCLLTRELPTRAIIRLWDTCLAEDSGFERFFPYVCAAFLCHFSDTIRQLEAEKLHLFLQNLPTHDWGNDEVETLLSEAYILSTLFQDAPNHLFSAERQNPI